MRSTHQWASSRLTTITTKPLTAAATTAKAIS